MPQTTSETLLSVPDRRAGDQLRSVVHYDEAGFDILFLRDDVAERYETAEIERVVEDLRLGSFGKAYQEKLYVHGRLRCNVRLFEQAVEMHFPHDNFSGTAVAFDFDALSKLDTLISSCLDNILLLNGQHQDDT